jgi:hypothetical protein
MFARMTVGGLALLVLLAQPSPMWADLPSRPNVLLFTVDEALTYHALIGR